jgi:hypothetical protein
MSREKSNRNFHPSWDRKVLNDRFLKTYSVSSFSEYLDYKDSMSEESLIRGLTESGLSRDVPEFDLPGYCFVCQRQSLFHVDGNFGGVHKEGKLMPNWRERLLCDGCNMNSRMRATIHIFEMIFNSRMDANIYVTEQVSPLFNWFNSRFHDVVGSEYLGGDIPLGAEDHAGIRNEDLTCLSFEDESFDYVVCLDVLEHIPDYEGAILECLRVLKPGGVLLFSAPFNVESERNIFRARIDETGKVVHLLPPEYHGDPFDPQGCLCFTIFGWELLEELIGVGFQKPECLFYWSVRYGYLGNQFIFLAHKK